jgi:hypothetical protein
VDEAHFYLNDCINKQNVWTTGKVYEIIQTPLHPQKYVVCSGVVGPVNANHYLHILEEQFPLKYGLSFENTFSFNSMELKVVQQIQCQMFSAFSQLISV